MAGAMTVGVGRRWWYAIGDKVSREVQGRGDEDGGIVQQYWGGQEARGAGE